jgi:hypothetical protein
MRLPIKNKIIKIIILYCKIYIEKHVYNLKI